MKKKVAVYPGSFDPITFGHLNIIERALQVFDEIVVAVVQNPHKTPLFTVQERVEMIKTSLKDKERIRVDSFSGLLVDYMEKVGARVIIRGLRAVSDFDYEFQMATINARIKPDIETFFMMTGESFFFINSRLVKEIAAFGGDVNGFVPPPVVDKLKEKLGKQV